MLGRFFFELGLVFSVASGRPNFAARCLARFYTLAVSICRLSGCGWHLQHTGHGEDVSYEVNIEEYKGPHLLLVNDASWTDPLYVCTKGFKCLHFLLRYVVWHDDSYHHLKS